METYEHVCVYMCMCVNAYICVCAYMCAKVIVEGRLGRHNPRCQKQSSWGIETRRDFFFIYFTIYYNMYYFSNQKATHNEQTKGRDLLPKLDEDRENGRREWAEVSCSAHWILGHWRNTQMGSHSQGQQSQRNCRKQAWFLKTAIYKCCPDFQKMGMGEFQSLNPEAYDINPHTNSRKGY